MSFYMRKPIIIGTRHLHLRFNFTLKGFTSWGFKIGPWTHNVTRGKDSLDLPGPINWRSK
jgi:hypothetical protein